MSAAFDSQAVAAKPLASLSPLERANLKAKLDTQHEFIKGCFAEALAADGSYDSLVALKVAIVVNCETEQQYELDGKHAPDHTRLCGDLAAAMAKAGPGGQAGAAWVRAFRAEYDAHDEAFDEPAFGSLQAPSSSLPLPPPAHPRSTSLTSSTRSPPRARRTFARLPRSRRLSRRCRPPVAQAKPAAPPSRTPLLSTDMSANNMPRRYSTRASTSKKAK